MMAELDGLAVFNADFLDRAVHVGLDFVEKLHGFNDADNLALLDRVADLDEGIGSGRGSAVEGADHRAGERRAGLLRRGGSGRGGDFRGGNGHGHRLGDGDGLMDLNGGCAVAVDDSDPVFAFGDFEFGNAAFAHEVDQCLEFAQIHDGLGLVI